MTKYRPLFNKVLVEIDDKDAQWGKSSDGNIGGEVYREGKMLDYGGVVATSDYPVSSEHISRILDTYLGSDIMWHEGHEAGTVFEEDGKKYALIYWFDICGVRDDK